MSFHKDFVSQYLKAQRRGRGVDGVLKAVAKKHGMSVLEAQGLVMEEDLVSRLEGRISEQVEPILDKIYERAKMGDTEAYKFYLGSLVPGMFDPGVRKQRIANEVRERADVWEPIDVRVTPVKESKFDPLISYEPGGEKGSEDTEGL